MAIQIRQLTINDREALALMANNRKIWNLVFLWKGLSEYLPVYWKIIQLPEEFSKRMLLFLKVSHVNQPGKMRSYLMNGNTVSSKKIIIQGRLSTINKHLYKK